MIPFTYCFLRNYITREFFHYKDTDEKQIHTGKELKDMGKVKMPVEKIFFLKNVLKKLLQEKNFLMNVKANDSQQKILSQHKNNKYMLHLNNKKNNKLCIQNLTEKM